MLRLFLFLALVAAVLSQGWGYGPYGRYGGGYGGRHHHHGGPGYYGGGYRPYGGYGYGPYGGVACNISSPVGVWLRGASPQIRCSSVQGHFILDVTVYPLLERLQRTFSNTTVIKGCLVVREGTGLRSLSFLANLEETVCDESMQVVGDEMGISNVIEVTGGLGFDRIGLNSLKRVEGPGSIVLEFVDDNSNWDKTAWCFSDQEIRFLALHPQFQSKMYQPCHIDPMCYISPSDNTYRGYADQVIMLDLGSKIAPRCRLFYGDLFLRSGTDASYRNLENLEILIGQLTVEYTLLDDFDFLPNLKQIFSYYAPGQKNAELVLNYNPFLTNRRLNGLVPARSISIDNTATKMIYFMSKSPDELNPCRDFGQFEECVTPESKVPVYSEKSVKLDSYSLLAPYQLWYLATVIPNAVGALMLSRSAVIFLCMKNGGYLPKTRHLVALALFIAALVSIERCLFYQRYLQFVVFDDPVNKRRGTYYVPTFMTPKLWNRFIQFFCEMCVAVKHAVLAVIPLCYLDSSLFVRLKIPLAKRISTGTTYFGLLVLVITTGVLQAQLLTVYRLGRLPREEREFGKSFYTFYAVVVQNDAEGNALSLINEAHPDTHNIVARDDALAYGETNSIFLYEEQFFGYDKLIPDVLGMVFPIYVAVCDYIMIIMTSILYIFNNFVARVQHEQSPMFILLYLLLSANRIRWFINQDILENYCYGITSAGAESPCTRLDWILATSRSVLEKFPDALIFIVAICSWADARYHLYLASALKHRTVKREPTVGSKFGEASDIPISSLNTGRI